MTTTVVAIDLGATSGRVIRGSLDGGVISHEVVHRFPNGPHQHHDGLHWDVTGLFSHIREGLRKIGTETAEVSSIGVDSWAVDYGLLREGTLLREPFHYRDERTARGVERVHAITPFEKLFAKNGLQFLPFNTIYQLAAEDWSSIEADSLLLVPDLINFWLTGESFFEETNASTTGLLDVSTGQLSDELLALAGAPRALFAPLVSPGHVVGSMSASLRSDLGVSGPVIAVGSHDTASAVVASPLNSRESAYISCGTWGLVGVESEEPIVSDAARAANFTNERGVDSRIRFLHNVMGLWLLNESMNAWKQEGETRSIEELVERASHYTGPVSVFDVNDPTFMAPGQMPRRIEAWLKERGEQIPADSVAMVASIIESLARAFAHAVHLAGELSGREIKDICLTGGGSQIDVLAQRLADYAGVPVFAGPVEATAMGNIVVQARAIGALSGDVDALRHVVRQSVSPRVFHPSSVRQPA